MRVFVDASVLIAAMLSPAGGSSLVFGYIKAKKVIGITSQTVIDEVLEEDKQKKIKRSKIETEQFVANSGLVVREEITTDEIAPYHSQVDTEDAHLIAGALLTKCSHLLTLDKKHLLRNDIRKKFSPLKIVAPKDILGELVRK